MNHSTSDADRQKIEQICRLNAKFQSEIVEHNLSRRIVGGDVEHICLPVSGRKDVDQSRNQTADRKDWKGAQKTAPGEIGFSI